MESLQCGQTEEAGTTLSRSRKRFKHEYNFDFE
jgi:hypothetical protein